MKKWKNEKMKKWKKKWKDRKKKKEKNQWQATLQVFWVEFVVGSRLVWMKEGDFTFFTFLGNLPLKIFKSKLQPLNSPSHHEHHTAVLLTLHPTRWRWFYCDWKSWMRMISYHGYQIICPHRLQSHPATVTANFPRWNPHHHAPQIMSSTLI